VKPKYLVGLVAAIGVAVTAVVIAMGSQQTYVTFNDASTSGEKVQVRGTWVKAGGADYDADHNLFVFTLLDENGTSMEVHYRNAKPNNFEMAEEIVVGGRVENGVFQASSVLTKCPSKYEADSIHVG
jgi:cytochrome c-type biogenesis protein CcmE